MDLHQLRYFVAAAEAGTISRAAERSNVSQPSLSQQVRRLEETLGVRLFDRLGRGVALTDAGRALLPRARRILAEVEEAAAAVQVEVEEGRGRLAVGAIPTMAPYLLPPALAGLRQTFPECELIIREDFTEHLVEALVDNAIDVGIMSTPVEHELIEVEVIGREPMLVVAPAGEGHPVRWGSTSDASAGAAPPSGLQATPGPPRPPTTRKTRLASPAVRARARPLAPSVGGPATPGRAPGPGVGSDSDPLPPEIRLTDLRGRPTISLHEMHCLGQQISGFCASRRLGPNIVCRMTQLGTVLEFVRLGMGISIIPEMVAMGDTCPERRYLRFRDEEEPPTREIAIAWRRGRTRSRLAIELARRLRERFHQPAADEQPPGQER